MAKQRHKKGDRKNAKRVRRQTRPQGATWSTEAAAAGASQAAASARRPSRRWWELYPGRKERELDELKEAGFEPAETVSDDGRLVIRCVVPITGVEHPFQIRYPDLYPYFRCEVFAPPELGLAKHQNPYAGNLCLLGQSSSAWAVDDTAARIIASQLPKILLANDSGGPAPELEVAQPEPISAYVTTLDRSLVVVPASLCSTSGVPPRTLSLAIRMDPPAVRGFVAEVDGRATDLPPLEAAFKPTRNLTAKCVHLDALPPDPNLGPFVDDLMRRGLISEPHLRAGELMVEAISFPEEVAYAAAPERGWLFLFWRGVPGAHQGSLVKSERYDAAEQGLRIPAAARLRESTITLFGLGGLGGPLAHLLLQLRVGELRLVDHDTVSIGNAVRWPLGFGVAGILKVDALAELARTHYPETKVVGLPWRIGSSAIGQSADEWVRLEEAFVGSDLIIDATAELGVQLFLADAAAERDLRLITVEGREGGYGGLVVRYDPGVAGCYRCLKLHQRDGKLLPPRDLTGTTQPRGCASPTFTGAPFDLISLAAQAARVAAQSVDGAGVLAQTPENVSVFFARRDNTGAVSGTPRWEHHALPRHPECVTCS